MELCLRSQWALTSFCSDDACQRTQTIFASLDRQHNAVQHLKIGRDLGMDDEQLCKITLAGDTRRKCVYKGHEVFS